jgi:hypothetical protein
MDMKMKKNFFIVTILSLILLGSIVAGGFFYYSGFSSVSSAIRSVMTPDEDTVLIKNTILSFPGQSPRWLYPKIGKAINFYKSKVNEKTFTSTQIKSLMKQISKTPKSAVDRQLDKASVYALEYSVYPFLLKYPDHESYLALKKLLYSDFFLKRCFLYSETFVTMVPSTHPNYLSLMAEAISLNYNAFKHLPLTVKLNKTILNSLFYFSEEPNHISHQISIQYAQGNQLKSFISFDGSVYRYLTVQYKANLKLAYLAFLSDDSIFSSIPKNLQYVLMEEGAMSLKTVDGWFLSYKYYLIPYLDFLQDFIDTYYMFVVDYLVYLNPFVSQGKPTLDPVRFIPHEEKWQPKRYIVSSALQSPPVLYYDLMQVESSSSFIQKIESIRNKVVINLWKIATIPSESTSLYVVNYAPKGKLYTGGLICKKKGDLLFSDYLAVHSFDGQSIWRVGDNGRFNPRSFKLKGVGKTKKGKLEFVIDWKGKRSSNIYRLLEEENALIKGFVSYGNLL